MGILDEKLFEKDIAYLHDNVSKIESQIAELQKQLLVEKAWIKTYELRQVKYQVADWAKGHHDEFIYPFNASDFERQFYSTVRKRVMRKIATYKNLTTDLDGNEPPKPAWIKEALKVADILDKHRTQLL